MTSSAQAPVPAEHPAAGTGGAPVELAPRELAALTALASGLTADHAARLMGTSGRTVRRAQRDAADRLGVESPVQAVVIAAAAGLIDLERVRRRRPLSAWPDELPGKVRAAYAARSRAGGLSPAEWQRARGRANRARVAALWVRGLSHRQIADATGLGLKTVQTHVRAVQRQDGRGG